MKCLTECKREHFSCTQHTHTAHTPREGSFERCSRAGRARFPLVTVQAWAVQITDLQNVFLTESGSGMALPLGRTTLPLGWSTPRSLPILAFSSAFPVTPFLWRTAAPPLPHPNSWLCGDNTVYRPVRCYSTWKAGCPSRWVFLMHRNNVVLPPVCSCCFEAEGEVGGWGVVRCGRRGLLFPVKGSAAGSGLGPGTLLPLQLSQS